MANKKTMVSVYTIVNVYRRKNYERKSCNYFFRTKEDAEATFNEWIESKRKQYKSAKVYQDGDYTVLEISRIGLVEKYKAVEIHSYNINTYKL